ncbi:MAG: hypothetical protein ABIQ56_06625 [Chitinophagaceae bacterium]
MRNNLNKLPALFKAMAIIVSLLLMVFSTSADNLLTANKKITVRVEVKDDHLEVVLSAPGLSFVQFFLFDVYGELVTRCEITGSKTLIVNKLCKGTYMYDAFANDAKIKSGNIELK